MVKYRRDFMPGATYFFTLALKDRQASYLTTHIKLLGQAFRRARELRHFTTQAIVILPDHLHVIWQMPLDDCDYSQRWRLVKGLFTKDLLRGGVPLICNSRGEYNLWQRRFWEHRIRDEHDLQKHCDYIHKNPVKHGYVRCPNAWPYSSIHRFIKGGMLPKDWGGSPCDGTFGE